jgi:PPOX class probable F420-dependent enzyme
VEGADPPWLAQMRTLLEAPSPAVLVTTRRDGAPAASPVWFRYESGTFEVVIARGDVKLRHLEREPRCGLVIFEAEPPFRGIEVRGEASVEPGDVTTVRRAIVGRYIGPERAERFVAARAPEGVVVRLDAAGARTWDLGGILPP